MTTEEARKLATGVLDCAVRDCHGRQAGDRAASLAWLASRQATPYFDLLELNQAAFLESMRWPLMARDAMIDPEIHLTEEQYLVIGKTFDYFSQFPQEGLEGLE